MQERVQIHADKQFLMKPKLDTVTRT